MYSPRATRVIRDPIHGNINIFNSEQTILDTKEFQRLRFIAQLSLCSLVYPGAVHNRFSHSLGAMHVAGEMYKSIVSNTPNIAFRETEFNSVRLAALVHDIGHGPFSHIFERGVSFFNTKMKTKVEPFHHEDMTIKILKTMEDKIDSDFRELVFKLVEGKGLDNNEWWLSQIIASEIDADRADFLLRDSYYAGVSYGNYEIERILETMSVAEDNLGKKIIVFKKKGLMSVESFLFARYNMYRGVYFHHTNLIGDAMISRAIFELIKRDLYPKIAISKPEEFIKWNDSRVFGIFHEMANSESVNFPDDPNFNTISGIVFRKLWKRLPIREEYDTNKLKELIIDYANENALESDMIFEEITVKKIPYTWLPFHNEGDKPTNIFFSDKNNPNKLQDFSELTRINVPIDFILNKQLLIHPDYIEDINSYIQKNIK